VVEGQMDRREILIKILLRNSPCTYQKIKLI
jgi:hypothetical protein